MGKSTQIKIIIADNDKLYLEAFRVLVSKHSSCELIEACSNYHDLMVSANLKHSTALFININFPDFDGLTYGSFIKARYPDIKAYALTLNKDDVVQQEILENGYDGFIYKPASTIEFEQIIKSIHELDQ